MTLRITYHGESLSIFTLQKWLGLNLEMMRRWHRRGILNERVIDAHLKSRAEHYQRLRTACIHGVDHEQYRDRIRLGWDHDEAATTPVLDKHRRRSSASARKLGPGMLPELSRG